MEENLKFQPTMAIDLITRVNSEPAPNFIWGNIPEGSTGLITGVAKTGKTTFAENLAISLAVGKTEFFNRKLDGRPRKVLFANLEESYRIRSRRNQRQIQSLSESERQLFAENYFSIPIDFPQYITNDDDWQSLRDYVIDCDPEVLFIDSLSHLYLGDIEKSSTAQMLTKQIRTYLGDLSITTIVIHHNVKGNDKPVDQDSIAGSRFITQEFEYAWGFANIPTGGSYTCSLFNKYCENDAQDAYVYMFDEQNWISCTGRRNKFSLYKEQNIDRRRSNDKAEDILAYIGKQTDYKQDATVSAKELKLHFVQNSTDGMAKASLYNNLNKLSKSGDIVTFHGSYGITKQGLDRL